MTKRATAITCVLIPLLFLFMNRGAYRGFFENDDLGTLGWTPQLPVADYFRILVSPAYQANNFRPVGHLYYRAAEYFFGLDFAKYIAIVHLLHLFNVVLLWFLLRRFRSNAWTAVAACAFFGFRMALFETFWKPMYVFDVLCGTFCLLSLLAYSRDRWILSFIAFWMAYKSKELAVMCPLVLVAYEYWFGKRRWVRLLPFLAVSLSFGIQGMLGNDSRSPSYAFRFTPAAMATTLKFYSEHVFLVSYLGLVLPLFALRIPDRRVRFGLAAMLLLFAPMLLLPGRLHGAYCYTPFLGLAVAFSGIAGAVPRPVVAAFFLLWAPAEYRRLHQNARVARDVDQQVRTWVNSISAFAKPGPHFDAAIYAGAPAGLDYFGVDGGLHYLLPGQQFSTRNIEDGNLDSVAQRGRIILLNWDAGSRKLTILSHSPQDCPQPYVEIDAATPFWQLTEGWYSREGAYRWIAPRATAQLGVSKGARRFELHANIGNELIQKLGTVDLHVFVNGRPLGPRRFTHPGWHIEQWAWEQRTATETARVEFVVEPGYYPQGGRPLGIAIGAFGFRP
jgi:hypothetical protein